MRPAVFVLMCLGFLAACEPDSKISPVTVQWMDWPAEVNAGQPFRTRLVVWGICAVNPRFHAGATADQSAVTFAPYYVIENDNIACLTERTPASLVIMMIDTAGTAPGLAATYSRTFEMRAAAETYTRASALLESLPVRTFGVVTVRPSGSDNALRNAAGVVSVETDVAGCVRVRPFGVYSPDAALVLEDQADTVGLSYAFVRGYIHQASAPICGETRVFHLVTRN